MGRVGQIATLGWILCGLVASARARADSADAWPPVPTTAAVNVPAVWQVPPPGAQIQPPPPAAGPPGPAGSAPAITRVPPLAGPGAFFDPAVQPAAYQQPFVSAEVAEDATSPGSPMVQSPPAAGGPMMIGDADGPVIAPGSGLPYQAGLVPNRPFRIWQPYVMLETVFLAPVQNVGGSSANYTFDNGGGPFSSNTKSVNGMILTPRISLGLMGARWGVGVRFWSFNNDQGSESFPTSTSQGIFSQSLMKMQTFDLEAIRRIEFNDTKLWVSVGVRYGSFVRTSTISSNDYYLNSIYSGAASSGVGFHGVGPTLAWNGLCPMGDSNWSWFYGGRVSWLWDSIASSFAQTDNSYVSTSGANVGSYYATNVGSGNAFIGELQLGAQYNHALQYIPVTAFFRIAGEYQYWHVNYGGNSFSASGAAPSGITSVASSAGTSNSDLGMVGMTVAAGFMW